MAGEIYTRQEIANKLPNVTINGIKFPVPKKGQYNLTPDTKISYILIGATYYKKEELQPRTISVGITDFVQGNISSISVGEEVTVEDGLGGVKFEGIVTNFSASSISVKEIL